MSRIQSVGGRAVCVVLLILLLLVGWHVSALAQTGSAQTVFDATPYLDSSKPDFGIQRAIDDASAAGGGVVVLPAGTFTLETYLQLKNGVTLKGQGTTTVLAAGRNEQRVYITANYAASVANTIQVADVAPLDVGMVVYVWRSTSLSFRPSAYTITSINQQARTITLDKKVSYPLTAGVSQVSFGLYTKLTQQVRSGNTSYTLHVADPSVFKVGEGLAIVISSSSNTGHHSWGVEENIVTAIDTAQKTLTLKDHIELNAPSGTVVAHGYGAIMTEGLRSKNVIVENVGIEDLAIRGWDTPEKPAFYAFSLGAINLMDCRNASISRVLVSDWHSDGVSIQACSTVQVTDVTSVKNRGRGFHPGTSSDHMDFLRIHGNDNFGYAARSIPGDGFFYCWQNKFVNVRQSEFRNNADSGIGDLGGGEAQNTSVDTNNLIEDNVIEDNGRSGIEISGGGMNANSTIRRNTIRNNGRLFSDSAGVYIGATKGYAYKYLVDSNLIESNINPATQLYGIREVNKGSYNTDYNTITNNKVLNHSAGNIIVVGSHTIVSGNDTTSPVSVPTATSTPAPVGTAEPTLTPTSLPDVPTPTPDPPVTGNLIALTGAYTDQPQSAGSEQAASYQALLVTMGVQVSQAGTFNAAADLVDAAGNTVAHAETTTSLNAGEETLTLRFDASDIYASAENGPYTLTNVLISDANGTRLVDDFNGSYLTAAYDYHNFEIAASRSVFLPVVQK